MKTIEERLHYKDADPVTTTNIITNILFKNGIMVEEEWKEPDQLLGTYTVRVTIEGTNIGANGKGINREYARASGYAELIERIQNDILLTDCIIEEEARIPFALDPDEMIKSGEEIIRENNSFIQNYFKCVGLKDGKFEQKVKHLQDIFKIDYIMRKKNNSYLTTPFYSFKYKKISYIPSFAYRSCYGSNGMAAGNTREEAIIQGISEIIERYIQYLVFRKNISFPDIPMYYIDRYPYIKDMYLKLKDIKDYKFILKDCSLGGKYPVAALIGIEKNTGRYGVKFGCHPDFGIAMERTFTEATQGRKITEYTTCCMLDFFNENVYTEENMANTCKVGNGVYPYQFFDEPSLYQFTEMPDVSEQSNKKILRHMIQRLLKDQYDVLIRDVSSMGFPSFHIIIPGMSEIKECSDTFFRIQNTQCYIMKKLENIKTITVEDCKYITSIIKYYANSYLENDIHKYFIGVNPEYRFPGEDGFSGALFLASMCNIFTQEYDKAAFFIKCLIKTAKQNGVDMRSKEIRGYIATRLYLEGMINLSSHEKVLQYLKNFFDEDFIRKIDYFYGKPGDVMEKIYGKLPKVLSPMAHKKMEAKICIEKARLNNPIDQMKLATILT